MIHATDDAWEADAEPRPVGRSMLRGFRGRCPACGEGRLFSAYLKVVDACPACGEAMHHHRADDAPPYFTIVIVGHIIVPLMLIVEQTIRPAMWVHFVIWLPLLLISTLLLLPMVKGAVVGLQWALRMHGFDPNAAPEGPIPDPAAVVASRP